MEKSGKNLMNLGKLIFIGVLLFYYAGNLKSQGYDFPQLIDRIQLSQIQQGIIDNSTMDLWVSSQNSNGSWSDLTYGKLSSSVSTSNNHLYRIWNLAAAVTKTGHVKYNDPSYLSTIKIGLEFWYGANTVDPNWWFNKIYFPQKLGEIMILMREIEGSIPTTSASGIDEPELLSLFTPTSIIDITSHGTGANAIDIARHYVYRGILTENSSLLESTRNQIELILTENIKGDLVYQDHGPQIQISSYGWVFCDGLMRLATYLAGSPAAFDTQSENFLAVLRFIRETQVSSIRGRSWDFGVMGRAVSRPNALNANLNYLQALADFIDPENATQYLDDKSRISGNSPADYKVREFNKHYWESDYSQHARSGYLFTVRNTSTRTVEAETGNGENLKANYLSYGANFMSIDGDEYTNIMPVWDWSMIPGTTFPYITSFPSRSTWGTNYGATTFVGGVSDGTYGAATLDLSEAGIKGKKSWFFFENEIVCLGAGIADNSNRNVRTTINQCWMKAPSYICETGSTSETMQSVSSSVFNKTNLKYLRQNKFAYFFPEQGNVKYTMKSQTGSWYSINSNQSTAVQSGYVFSMWLDHGSNPANANYSYVVVPGVDTKQKAQDYDMSVIKILENNSDIQAVYNSDLDVLQVIFYKAGTLVHGSTEITVDRACALMFRNGTLVTVSDPTQTHSVVVVTINVNGTNYNKIVSLPSLTEEKGASTTIDFNIELPTTIEPDKKVMSFTFYPNPTEGISRLKVDVGHQLVYQIKDINGRILKSDQFTGEVLVDLTDCPSGVYVVTVISDNDGGSKKILKK